ncbi:MAG: molybdate ABC transporter substrate-binding protein [Anaerolineales bacterium]|jgi:molybdate transport system substrate-binding protein
MKKLPFIVLLFAAILLASCGPAAKAIPAPTAVPPTETMVPPTDTPLPPTATPAPRTLTVFAAASLTGSFGDIGKAFEAANPGVTVTFNFAGSQVLSTQITQGAAADVFASANHTEMDKLVTANLVAAGYKDFVTNVLEVILPANNPANVQTLQDLAKPGLKLVLEDKSVPAGAYSLQILANMSKDPTYGSDFNTKVLANVVSNETDVKQVVAKVQLGEADAGIVYITDAIAAPTLKTIVIPTNFNVVAKYPIAALTNAPQPDLASAFVAYVLSEDGQAIMKKWGFTTVTP